MVACKGIVKDNVVVLEEGARLPDGAEVEVRLVERALSREEAFMRVWAQRLANAKYHVGLDDIIEEDEQEREEHPDTWMASNP